MNDTYEEQIKKLTELLEIQQKLHETAVDTLKPAVDVAYQKGYADAMNWKTQNHIEHLEPKREWVGLTDKEISDLHHELKVQLMGTFKIEDIYRVIETKLRSKNNWKTS
jgi:hypothetical protein